MNSQQTSRSNSDDPALGMPFAPIAALPYLILLAGAYLVFSSTSVGPFITFRYAANILAGHGPVYNAGEHVEGFTSPLHLILITLLLIPLHQFGLYFKVKLLGLAFGLAGIWQMRTLARQVGLSDKQSLACQILLALNVNYAMAAINGLETTLYITILLTAVATFIRERDSKSGYWSAFFLFLALCTRPEAGLIFFFLLMIGVNDCRQAKSGWKRLAVWSCIYLGLASIFLAARWSYYGLLVPNTYFAKAVPLHSAIPTGIKYIGSVWYFRALPQIAIILAAAMYWGAACIGLCKKRDHKDAVIIAAAILASIIFELKSGSAPSFSWRYMEPAAPFLAIFQVWGVWAVTGEAVRRCPRVPAARLIAATAFIVLAYPLFYCRGLAWSKSNFTTSDREFMLNGGSFRSRDWISAANEIHHLARDGELVAGTDTGYMAYTNPKVRFIEMRGLTDREIAGLPDKYKSAIGITDKQWTTPDDPMYKLITRKHPDYIVSYSFGALTLPGYTLVYPTVGLDYDGYTPFKIYRAEQSPEHISNLTM